ncbi:hypothetical protein EDC19_2686 [Natranaerovirga hydrolytica]|uniref:Uncharacterized protein n=1 Tax=Natranaerovirga hydrolytica TaxID=680378 RepID=A0A4R1MDC8_9FIRM|nr:hypothetical protein [Natranaerovirga hydrolytica]TCK88039.1 hypothetical protein EDC19_2686 [Natranaerovirga hydrolytica]
MFNKYPLGYYDPLNKHDRKKNNKNVPLGYYMLEPKTLEGDKGFPQNFYVNY